MHFTPNGKIVFDDIYEMYYNLFIEIGLSIDSNTGYLFDQDNGIPLKFKDKFIKATTNPIPIYAGKNDILFEPAKNYALITNLMGYYIDKESVVEGKLGYIAQYIDDNPTGDKQRVVVKTRLLGDVYSQYYKNIYLGYIECIFKLSQNYDADLSNFDFDSMN